MIRCTATFPFPACGVGVAVSVPSSGPRLCFQLVTRTKKIFVGGLSVNTTIDDVKQYFDQFGKVSEGQREMGRSHGNLAPPMTTKSNTDVRCLLENKQTPNKRINK